VSVLTDAPSTAGDNRHVARRVSSPEFVGRSEELGALEAALERAAGGEAATLFVAGESGVGKTRLLRELQRRAEDAGVRVLRGDCVAFGAGELPYAPIAGALRSLRRDLGPEAFDELIGPRRNELARLLPELGAEPAADGRDVAATGEPLAQARLFGLLRGLLDQLAAEAPVVFIVDDLQWADRSTLEFLSSLLRGARDERLLTVCTYRSDELHRRHPLRPFLAEEERREGVERLELARFSLLELSQQVTGILGATAKADLVARLHERSEGNPFFAEELVAASAEGDGPLPASLRDVLTLRFEALPQDARTVLSAAAAAGRRSSHRLLTAAAGLHEDALLEGLREAVAHHLLVLDDDGYSFRHALLQEATYGDLLPGERTALHLRLAEALSADPTLGDAGAAELAQHWRAAHRLPDALAAFAQAGREAERAAAFAEAGAHYEAALEIWERVDDAAERAGTSKAQVVARAADARHLAGEHHRAVALGRTAIELTDATGDVVEAALARQRLGRYLWLAGDSDASLQAYREAVRVLPPDPPTAELASVLAAQGQILVLRGPGEESGARLREAIEIARAVGARDVEGHALNSLGVTMAAMGDWTGAERAMREAAQIARELSLADDICRATVNLSDSIDQQGRIAEAAEMALEGARASVELGLMSYCTFLEGDAAWRLARLGELDDAEAIVERGLALHLAGVSEITMRDSAGHVALRRGRLDEAERHFQRATAAMRPTSDSMFIGNHGHGRAEVALWRSDPDEAWKLATAALELVAEREYLFYTARLYATALKAAADIAQRARTLGDDARADGVVRDARALHARFRGLLAPERWVESPAPEVLSHEALCAAELTRADGSSSPDAWAAAASRFDALGMPFELAYARWRQAEASVLAGDRPAAAEALREADRLAGELRSELLAAEIEGLARRARIALAEAPEPPAADSGLDALGLTDRERSVLELVAEGRTNREIGEALFMAEKTASVHVSRILAKLGVRSRVEAATAAHRLGASSPPGDGGRG
jgi:DNA-binding CsgD family transcriptional regulator/tetratricopeptide (TPR) repeat protein